MTNGDKIRKERGIDLDDVDIAGLICLEQPECKKCKYYTQDWHCMVMEYVKQEVEE